MERASLRARQLESALAISAQAEREAKAAKALMIKAGLKDTSKSRDNAYTSFKRKKKPGNNTSFKIKPGGANASFKIRGGASLNNASFKQRGEATNAIEDNRNSDLAPVKPNDSTSAVESQKEDDTRAAAHASGGADGAAMFPNRTVGPRGARVSIFERTGRSESSKALYEKLRQTSGVVSDKSNVKLSCRLDTNTTTSDVHRKRQEALRASKTSAEKARQELEAKKKRYSQSAQEIEDFLSDGFTLSRHMYDNALSEGARFYCRSIVWVSK
jgi:hypothetical protein